MASVILQLVACLIVADFITGLVHWWEDTYGLPSWPILGALVIEPNIAHHRDPSAIGRMGALWGRNWEQLLLAAMALAIFWLVGWLSWQLAAVALMASAGNEVHAWCHGAGNSFTGLLQDMAIVIQPRQHNRHHKPPYDRTFCTLTNLVNPLADRLRLWRGLEWSLAHVGVHPNRMNAERGGL